MFSFFLLEYLYYFPLLSRSSSFSASLSLFPFYVYLLSTPIIRFSSVSLRSWAHSSIMSNLPHIYLIVLDQTNILDSLWSSIQLSCINLLFISLGMAVPCCFLLNRATVSSQEATALKMNSSSIAQETIKNGLPPSTEFFIEKECVASWLWTSRLLSNYILFFCSRIRVLSFFQNLLFMGLSNIVPKAKSLFSSVSVSFLSSFSNIFSPFLFFSFFCFSLFRFFSSLNTLSLLHTLSLTHTLFLCRSFSLFTRVLFIPTPSLLLQLLNLTLSFLSAIVTISQISLNSFLIFHTPQWNFL